MLLTAVNRRKRESVFNGLLGTQTDNTIKAFLIIYICLDCDRARTLSRSPSTRIFFGIPGETGVHGEGKEKRQTHHLENCCKAMVRLYQRANAGPTPLSVASNLDRDH